MIARAFCRQAVGVYFYLSFKAIVLPVLHALLSAIIIASVWISMQGHARAESIVKPATTIYYAEAWPTSLDGKYSSPSAACSALAASYNNSAGTAYSLYYPDNNYCQILDRVSGISIYLFPLSAYALTCPDHAYRYSGGYGVNSASCACFAGYVADPSGTSCVSTTACPANSSGTYPDACTCNAGYEPNSAKTGCVPVSKCTVHDLPPITDPDVLAFENNSNTSDTARLTSEMQAALQRLVAAASAAGGAPTVGSAYRPPAYNQHLIDVWEKWMNELKNNKESACVNLKTKIHNHFNHHGLLESQSPVPNSRHTRGVAVDVSIDLPPANIDSLARGSGLRRPLPIDDPVHFQFP